MFYISYNLFDEEFDIKTNNTELIDIGANIFYMKIVLVNPINVYLPKA